MTSSLLMQGPKRTERLIPRDSQTDDTRPLSRTTPMEVNTDERHTQSFPTIDLTSHTFTTPQKLINTHDDLNHFLRSKAHALIITFITHLSAAVTPSSASTAATEAHYTDSPSIH